jgi:nicotinate-nucleotide adenylyltransferase
MSTWHRLEETKALATVALIERAGEHADPPGAGWMVEHVTIPRLDVSSTEVRERCANGIPIDGLVPLAVVRLIADRGLYAGRR